MVAPQFQAFASGVETHVAEVAPRLAATGARVTILATDPGGSLPTREWVRGVEVRRVRAWPAKGDLHFAPRLMPMLAEGGPWDLIHIQSYHTLVAPMVMIAAITQRIPFVITLHSGGHSSRIRVASRGIQLKLLRPLLRRAERIIAVSHWERDRFSMALGIKPGRIAVIPNGAQLPRLDPPVADGPPLIVSIGRLERYKGHHRVVAAMPRIIDALPDARLRIVGSGPYAAALRDQATQLGVGGLVEIGPVPGGRREAFTRLLLQASVVAMLSDYESQGIAAYEAADAGRPLVVALGTALAELVDRGVAIGVADLDNPEAVASAIVSQIRSPLITGGIALPTWDECADSLGRLYRDVLGR
jgi:glycosyltransferase involved in cell wall biosynthesis